MGGSTTHQVHSLERVTLADSPCLHLQGLVGLLYLLTCCGSTAPELCDSSYCK